MLNTQPMTVEEFSVFAQSSENVDRMLELINGEIIEVSPGRTRYSEIGQRLTARVYNFCKPRKILCHTSGGEGVYNIHGNVVAPDFAYKQTSMSEEYPDPEAPLWVVEIISQTDKAADIRKKREIYLRSLSIDVYASVKPLKIYAMGEMLDVGEVLPGFALAVADLFA